MTVAAPGGWVLAAAQVAQALSLGQALVQLQALPGHHYQVTRPGGAPEEAQQGCPASWALQQGP